MSISSSLAIDLTGDSLSRDDEVLGERESTAMGDSEQERSKPKFSLDDDFSSLDCFTMYGENFWIPNEWKAGKPGLE